MANQALQAKAELARRELARRRFLDFVQYTYAQYQAAAVHKLLAEHLEQVELYVTSGGREGIGRLMIFMPPRHGKSEQVSVRFPAWFLGRNPDYRAILASCTANLAEGFSRQARNLIMDTSYQALFGVQSKLERPVQIAADSRSVSAWDLEGRRGGFKAVGVGGAIIGKGAHLLVIDDPYKGRKEAESKSYRDMVDNWYRSEAYTRLSPDGAVVLMHQRWHEDDLAGRLLRRSLDDPRSDRWTVLSLPAVAEEWAEEGVSEGEVRQALKQGWYKTVDPLGRRPGEALWPERFPLSLLSVIQANLGGYDWDALYQQRAQPLEGALIKAYQIIQVRRGAAPEARLLTQVRYWDLAVSASERADWIVGARLGRADDGRIYILDVARFKGPWADARPKMLRVMLADGPSVTQGIEVAGQQGGYCQELQRDKALVSFAVKGVNPKESGGKQVRANVWASRIPDGLIYLVKDAGWEVDGFLSECIAFPTGRFDDQVDGVSGAIQMLGFGMGSFSDVPQDDKGSGQNRWDLTEGRVDSGLKNEVGNWRL